MAKGLKIQKNLSDADMLVGYEEEITFENAFRDNEPEIKKPAKKVSKEENKEGISSFFTPELQDEVGKALLQLKVKLYQEGVINYQLKVTQEGKQIILTAVPTITPEKKVSEQTGVKGAKGKRR